jgi:hypothetical protein
MATFGGVDIFGVAVKMQACVVNPYRLQNNNYPGLSFGEFLRQGEDGAYTFASGRLFGANGAALTASLQLFRSYVDGYAYTLVDTTGTSWTNVILESFVPAPGERIVRDFATGYVWQAYAAKFIHIDY